MSFGSGRSGGGSSRSAGNSHRRLILDTYSTLAEVTDALQRNGVESSNLVVAIDYTTSNTTQGRHTHGGHPLHDIAWAGHPTPYIQCLSIIARTLDRLDEDGMIPTYGFGCSRTHDDCVFSFLPGDAPCEGLGGVVRRCALLGHSKLLWPGLPFPCCRAAAFPPPPWPLTRLPPAAVTPVPYRPRAHALGAACGAHDVCACDLQGHRGGRCHGARAVPHPCHPHRRPDHAPRGPRGQEPVGAGSCGPGYQVRKRLLLTHAFFAPRPPQETEAAIVAASHFPLSIVVIGVGDGPWDKMVEFDDDLPVRAFDNFQFCEHAATLRKAALTAPATEPERQHYIESQFAVAALQEVPEQYREMVRCQSPTLPCAPKGSHLPPFSGAPQAPWLQYTCALPGAHVGASCSCPGAAPRGRPSAGSGSGCSSGSSAASSSGSAGRGWGGA